MARLPQGKQSQGRVRAAGSEAVQEAREEHLWWRGRTPPLPGAGCRASGAAGRPGTPKGLRSGGQQGWSEEAARGRAGALRPALGLAECSGPGTSPAASLGTGGTGRFGGALGQDVVLTQARWGGLVPAVSCLWPAAKPSALPSEKPSFSGSRKLTSSFPKGHLGSNAAEQSARRAEGEHDLPSPPAWLCGASLCGPGGIESPPEGQSCRGPMVAPEGGRTRTRVLQD